MSLEEALHDPGHQAVLRHLGEREQEEPLIRAQVSGTVVFDLFVRILREQGGRVRIDDLIAALASLGGHLCLVAVLDTLAERRLTPAQVGMVEVEGHARARSRVRDPALTAQRGSASPCTGRDGRSAERRVLPSQRGARAGQGAPGRPASGHRNARSHATRGAAWRPSALSWVCVARPWPRGQLAADVQRHFSIRVPP